MVKEDKATWKANYFLKIGQLLDEYPKCFIVNADNVGSKQMQQIRRALRKTADVHVQPPIGSILQLSDRRYLVVVLMGKNTMMRKAIRLHAENNKDYERVLPFLVGNVGMVFTKADLIEVREILLQNKVKAPARAGAIAPCPVVVPKQATTLGPEKTSFFQALQITTKITKGCIEILNDVNLIQEGDKVGASEATLLNMLNISPFSYGLVLQKVYDQGSVYDPKILDIKPEDLHERFLEGVRNIACISLNIGYPTVCSAPHSIINGFKRLLAIAVETDIDFKEANQTKEFLKDPSKFAAAVAAAAPAPAAAGGGGAEPKKEEKKEESEEESDEDMGFGLFD